MLPATDVRPCVVGTFIKTHTATDPPVTHVLCGRERNYVQEMYESRIDFILILSTWPHSTDVVWVAYQSAGNDEYVRQ